MIPLKFSLHVSGSDRMNVSETLALKHLCLSAFVAPANEHLMCLFYHEYCNTLSMNHRQSQEIFPKQE